MVETNIYTMTDLVPLYNWCNLEW